MSKLSQALTKLSDLVAKATEILVIPITLGFSLVILAGVITRFVLKISFTTSMEFSRIFFVWFCFFGSSLAYKRGQHIQFTFVTSKVPENVRRVMNVIIDCACLTFFIILFFQSIKLAKKVSMTVFPASGISYTVMYVALPIASVFFIVHALNFLCRDICKFSVKEAE